MSLPSLIPAPTAPFSAENAAGQQIIDINWYLFLYNMWKNVMGAGGGEVPFPPTVAIALTEIDVDAADIPHVYQQIANTALLQPDVDDSQTQLEVANAMLLADDYASWGLSGSGGSPSGPTGAVQRNVGGAFYGDTNLLYDSANIRLSVGAPTPLATVHAYCNVYGGFVGIRSENTSNAGWCGIENFVPTYGRKGFFVSYCTGASTTGIYSAGNTYLGATSTLSGAGTNDLYAVSEIGSVLIVSGGTATTNVRVSADAAGNVAIGNAALATSATDGFLYIPTCAGVPTGVPTSKTGRIPLVFDTTNNNLYVYNSGWKKTTTFT